MTQEAQPKEGREPLSPQQKVESLLQRTPAGPDFAQATIAYTNECIEAATAKFGEVLVRQSPKAWLAIEDRLQDILQPRHRSLTRTSFVTEGDRKLLEFPNGSRLPLNRIAESVYDANPELGVLQYIIPLYPPRNQREVYQRFPWFENRLNRIVETGQFPLDDPRTEFISVGYVTQVGKAFAVDKARRLLKRAQPFAGVSSAEGAIGFLDNIGDFVAQIRMDQHFVARGFATMQEIAERVGFDEQQTRLLLDLAFLRNRAFDQPAEFKQALEPIIRLIAVGDWEGAFDHRDFVLRYFVASFPAWRIREVRATGEITFESFKDLARAVVQHRLVMYDEEVPDEYKQFFGGTFPKKVERAQRERNEAIVRRSVGLSNTVVKELAVETERMLGFRDPEVKSPPYVIRRPDKREILTVELMEDRQVYWYKTEGTVTVRLRGRIQVMMKNYGNFGRLLHDLILRAHQKAPERPVLNLDEIRTALQRAYEQEREHDPIVAQFTLGDYLRALFSTVQFAVELTDVDPVIKFTKEMDTSR